MRGYSIGDVSRTLGLTPGALHFYEREGIIQVPKTKEGGRRYYTQSDLIRLLSCRKYRAMDIPLKTIAKQFSARGDTLTEIGARLEERREEARRKAAYYQQLAEEIDDFLERIRHLEEDVGHFSVRSSPEIYMLKLNDGLISPDKAEQAEAQRWLEAMPSTRISIVLDDERAQAEYCYTIRAKRAQLTGVQHPPQGGAYAKYIRDAVCIHTVVCDERMHEEPMYAFLPVLDYMKAHGFTLSGPAWASLIVVDCSEGTKKTYAQVWAPFA